MLQYNGILILTFQLYPSLVVLVLLNLILLLHTGHCFFLANNLSVCIHLINFLPPCAVFLINVLVNVILGLLKYSHIKCSVWAFFFFFTFLWRGAPAFRMRNHHLRRHFCPNFHLISYHSELGFGGGEWDIAKTDCVESLDHGNAKYKF